MAESDPGLSRAMRELWGLRTDGRRGPKPTLSVQAVATAAVDIADAEGLDAVTMAAVATRLGFTTMSLYRYVESRQDLLEVMLDAAYGPAPEVNRRRGWRGQIEEWARIEVARLFAHPWALSITLDSPPVGPNSVAWMDTGFTILERTGLPPQQAASALLAVDGYVRSSVQMAIQYAAPGVGERWAGQLRAVLADGAMPAVRTLLDLGAFEDGDDGPDEFEFGLGLLLDGIEQAAARR